MILLGMGSNLNSSEGRSPQENCQEAINRLSRHQIVAARISSFFESAPIPDSAQPWYVNSVALINTELTPLSLLECLLATEFEMGRNRAMRDAPRVIDLDLLAYDNQIIYSEGLTIPHPRMNGRAFVLKPLAEIAPNWVHPVCGRHIKQLIKDLDPCQIAYPICG